MESNLKSLWGHPELPIFTEPHPIQSEADEVNLEGGKLFLIPTLDLIQGEEPDQDYLPKPSYKSELPEIESWVRRYAVGVVEIWSSRRSAMQLARWSHRKVFKQLSSPSPITNGTRIRKIYLNEPIEGVIEATITLFLSNRVRSLALRFEGVDKRWLCTELILI